jgi:hypothetical protein
MTSSDSQKKLTFTVQLLSKAFLSIGEMAAEFLRRLRTTLGSNTDMCLKCSTIGGGATDAF